MLSRISFPGTRDWTHGTNTHVCFSGGDASRTDNVDVGGEILTTQEIRDWRGKIRRGEQATGIYSGTFLSCDREPGFIRSRRWCNDLSSKSWATEKVDGYLGRPTGDLAPPTAPSQSLPATTNAQALALFVSEARRAQSHFRGGTFLAELSDTLKGLRNPAKGIRNLIDSYHQRARRNARRAMRRDPLSTRVRDLSPGQASAATRAISETWLEYQFGIMPLISDIQDASRALDRFKNRQPRVPIMASKSNETVPVIEYQDSDLSLNVITRFEVHTSTTFSVKYYGAVKLDMDPFGSVAQESGTQVRDFLPALWEWIPYSFLVDYFSNIGDIVEAASFCRSNIAWAARTWHNESVRDGTRSTYRPQSSAVYPTSGAVDIQEYSPSRITWRRSFFSRAPYTGSFVPQLLVEVPGVKNTRRWLNIAALARLRGMRR